MLISTPLISHALGLTGKPPMQALQLGNTGHFGKRSTAVVRLTSCSIPES